MKYHTTLSTIVISILVLSCFALATLFCVFTLGIDSPGYLIATQALDSLEGRLPVDISFSSIDRNLSQRVRINDIAVGLDGKNIVEIDSLTLYMNPLSMIWAWISGSGRVEVDVNGLLVDLEGIGSGSGAGQDGPTLTLEDVNRLINSLESTIQSFSDQPFYPLSYSVNVEDFTLRLGAHLSFDRLRMNLSLHEGLRLERFVFSAPSISVSLVDAGLSASNLSLSLAHDGEGYSTRLSLDSVDLNYGELELSTGDVALALDFESLSSLDIRRLPLVLSAYDTALTYRDIRAGLGRISLNALQEGFDIVLMDLKLSAGGLEGTLPRLDLAYRLGSDSDRMTADGRGSLEFSYGNMSGRLESLSAVLSVSSQLTYTLNASGLSVDGLDGITNGLFSAVEGASFSASGQSNGELNVLDASVQLSGRSSTAFFDRTSLSLSLSTTIDAEGVGDSRLTVNSLDIPLLASPITAVLDYNDGVLSGSARYSDEVLLALDQGLRLEINSLQLDQFLPAVRLYAPILEAYIGSDTVLNGSFELSGATLASPLFAGTLLGSLAIGNIHFNQYTFNLASSISASSDGQRLGIDYFTVTTQWLRLSYSGYLNLDSLLPQGTLALELTDSGSRILNIDFSLDSGNEYYLNASIPYFENSYLRGSINWGAQGMVTSSGELRSGSTVYPFSLTLDFSQGSFVLSSSGLDLSIDFSENFGLWISFTNFELPSLSPYAAGHASIDGRFQYTFDLAAQTYSGRSEGFIIHNMGFVHSRPDVSFDLQLDNGGIRFGNILVQDDFTPLSGQLVYDSGSHTLAMTLGNGGERANLSLILTSGDYSGILILDNFTLDRFGLQSAVVNTTLIGRGENSSDFSFSGTLNLSSGGESGFSYDLEADVLINERGVESQSIVYSTDNFRFSSSRLVYSAPDGLLSFNADLSYDKVNRDRVYPVTARGLVNVYFSPFDTIVDAVIGTVTNLDSLEWHASLQLDEVNIDNMITVRDRTLGLSLVSDLLSLSGNLVSGSVSLPTMELDLTVEENSIGYGHISGRLDPDSLDLRLDGINFNLAFINWMCPVPLVNFTNEAWVYGDFAVYGTLSDTKLYGQGGSHGFDMTVWWLDNAYIHVGDTQVSVVDGHASTSMTPVVVVDTDDGGLHRGFAVAQAKLSNSNILDWYDVELWVPEDEAIHVRVPVYNYNIEIAGDVSGNFTINSDLSKINLSGTLDLYNARMSYGMGPLPQWWSPSRFEVSNNFDIVLRQNCSFVLPLSQQPIVRAYFDEDVAFHFMYDSLTGEKAINGTLSFRSGEIYYFQKNFFITEGSIVLPQSGADLSAIRMNFRARLRSYDSDGERVDIYLVLRNASFDNINPTFESTPAMSTEEIMSILGTSLLPESAYGSNNLSSVASLVTSGVDVLNRMGVINTSSYADLGSVVRDSLGFDIFSLRTSILENFLIDAVFSSSGSSYSFSPLATYLNNTSIYMGKYLQNNLYLQIMVYLQAVDSIENRTSFLSDDLSLDLEISLEWENPLGTITFFTSPDNLTLHSLFDNFGITYSNTIYF